MTYPSSKNSIITLDDWLDTPLGEYIRAWEQERLDALTADIFGFNAVQIGFPKLHALRANRMQHRWLSDMRVPQPAEHGQAANPHKASVIHDFGEIPFASQSLDLVVLPHVLEFASEPHQILREVERVLIPEGQVIISGFNPASLWGLRQAAGSVTGAHFLPEYAEFISLLRLQDWLKLLNLEVNRGHFGCYMPPCKSDKWLRRFSFMEKAGGRWWPYCGAVYMVQAIKRVKGMTLIGPSWVRKAPRVRQSLTITHKAPKSDHGKS